MKNGLLFFYLLFFCLLSSSCTVLQWRKSDEEIQKTFKKVKIDTEVSYFRVDSLDLDVRIQTVESSTSNANLIFLHGSPSSLSAWEGYLLDTTLGDIANMHAIDRPGYGYSNFGEKLPSMDTQSKIISAVINENNLDKVIIIGASYGGPIAARVGFLNPRVEAVVMVSPAIDPNNEKDIWASRLTQWWLTRWLVPTSYRVAGDEKKVHADELALIQKDWQDLAIPVLHFHGDIDKVVPYENIYFSQENFKNIEIISITEKGHEIAWKNRELIIPHLIKLIDKVKGK